METRRQSAGKAETDLEEVNADEEVRKHAASRGKPREEVHINVAELSVMIHLIRSLSSGGGNDPSAHQRGPLLFDVFESWTFMLQPLQVFLFFLYKKLSNRGQNFLFLHVGRTAESSSSSLQEDESTPETVSGFQLVCNPVFNPFGHDRKSLAVG